MSEVRLPSHITEALEVFASGCGFKKPKFEFFESSDKGYIGLIKRCKVSEGDRKLSVICKFLPDNKELNEKFSSFDLFRREVFVYQKFLPQLEKIQLENGLNFRDSDGFWSFPKLYHSNFDEESPEKSFIFMEDLTEESFVTLNTYEPIDFKHSEQLMIELGKFHAISFALRRKKPEVFEEFKSLTDLMCRLMTTETMRDLAPRNCQLASELFKLPEEKLQIETILSYKNDLWQQIGKLLEASNAELFGVVCHGDCWINNIMFNSTDEGQNEIKSLCLVDWQMTRFGSAASELMYFIFCHFNKKMRDKHMQELLEIYYKSLTKMLKLFDFDVNEIYPREIFDEELRKFGKFAFAMASFSIPILCKYPAKLFEDKNAELTEEEVKAKAFYDELMKDIVNDLIDMKAL